MRLRTPLLPINLLAILCALLMAGQVLSVATNPNATHVASEVCVEPTNPFC